MTFRAKIIFFGLIGLLVIVGLVLAIVFRPKKAPLAEEAAVSVVNAPGAPLPPLTIPSAEVRKPLTAAELSAAQKELAIKNQTKLFVERFGSYSPAANFANFDELKPIVTKAVANWLEQYKKQLTEKQEADFLGVTTKVISQKIISSDAAKASVLASVQREELFGSGPKVSYKDMRVELVWQNNEWLVDGAYWQ